MDTVTEFEMAATLMEMGGVGCIHRFMSIEDQVKQVKKLVAYRDSDLSISMLPIMAAVGVVGDYVERALALEDAGCNIILIDVAHGHHSNMQNALETLKEELEDFTDVIAGNIATAEAAEDLIDWGADGLRVGIGGGSLCTTRVKTGFGVPNVTSIEDVFRIADDAGVPIMADGGIKSSGDIAKALAVGADCVMVGSLLAGTKESPGAIMETSQGLFKRYRGSASLETKITHNQKQRNVEGESTTIPFKGGVKFIVAGLIDGVRSAFSYAGANNIMEYYNRAEYNVVTNAGLAEAKPHLIK
jgi:IMP dehydrogenase